MSRDAGDRQMEQPVQDLTASSSLGEVATSTASAALSTVKKTVAGPESESRKWKRTFESHAKEVNGQLWVSVNASKTINNHASLILDTLSFLDRESFVNAIAPHEDFTKIRRDQFAVLFKVADQSNRDLVSWDDFTVFQTLLKRPDADYLIAFKFFDV
jgi:solute carrier family 25 aspartate/glutamate transporter 12/13